MTLQQKIAWNRHIRKRLALRQERAHAQAIRNALLSWFEEDRSRGYAVNGSQFSGADVVHPHYVLMAGQLRQPDETRTHILRQRFDFSVDRLVQGLNGPAHWCGNSKKAIACPM